MGGVVAPWLQPFGGHDPVNIVTTVQNLLDMPPLFNDDLYGDGHTARTIVQRLLA